jgi:signal transduction histidine kinase
MSLRSKVVWLFIGLSVVPLLILAGFTYYEMVALVSEIRGPAGAEAFVVPFRRIYTSYWLFVVVLGASATIAFSMLLTRVTRNLEDLMRAAEQIAEGDLDPWLPPPNGDEVGQLTIAFSRMLERIRAMMHQVDQSGRLAVVGQLSSYLAHEIRTPLSSTRMNLQRLERWTRMGNLPEECAEPIEISLKEIDRLATSVSGVLTLARPQDADPVSLNLHEVVEESIELLRGEMSRRDIDLFLDLDASADRVLARPGQMKAVLTNLILNAIEAQPEGGQIEITSRLVRESEAGRPTIELRVRDEGPGIPASIQGRIFDPFFSTKSAGSGIGLAVAFQSVRDNGGELLLEPASVADCGAEFLVRLPLAPVTPERLHAYAPKRKRSLPGAEAWPPLRVIS